MRRPSLDLFLDGKRIHRVAAPDDFGARAWLLGVAAVQAFCEGERVFARLRANLTGAAPSVWPLGERAVVHAVLAEDDRAPPLPAIAPPALDGELAQLAVFLDGEAIARAPLAAPLDGARAFAHVFCRWLRDGEREPGFDLTRFAPPAAGEKFERLVARPLAPGSVVSLAWALAAPRSRPI